MLKNYFLYLTRFSWTIFFLICLSPLQWGAVHISFFAVVMAWMVCGLPFRSVDAERSLVLLPLFLIPALLYPVHLSAPGYQFGSGDLVSILSQAALVGVCALLACISGNTSNFIMSLMYALLLVAAIGVAQRMGVEGVTSFIDSFEPSNEYWAIYSAVNNRATSIFIGNPNAFGFACILGILILSEYNHLELNKFTRTIFFSIFISGVISSGSITSLCILTLLLGKYIIKSIARSSLNIKIGPATVLALAVAALVMQFDAFDSTLRRQKLNSENFIPSSLTARFRGPWQSAFGEVMQNPFFGRGPSVKNEDRSPDSFYIDLAKKNGLLGGGIIILMMGALCVKYRIPTTCIVAVVVYGIGASLFRQDQLNLVIACIAACRPQLARR